MMKLLAIVMLALVVWMAAPVTSQAEPMDLTGRWVGKYEEPVELTLAQSGEQLEGIVALTADPRGSGPVPVTGAVKDGRATVRWVVPGTMPFAAELRLDPSGVLFGLGGDANGLSTGFTMWRVQWRGSGAGAPTARESPP